MLYKIPLARSAYRLLTQLRFRGSSDYWEGRYLAGGNSGQGSYEKFAEFKADVLNDFFAEYDVESVVEFGCGDGNQLSLLDIQQYVGLDVSRSVIERCVRRFSDDRTKRFLVYDQQAFDDPGQLLSAEVALSLDVIYHLVEDEVYDSYMRNLFAAGRRFVVVYSSNDEQLEVTAAHVRHRRFTDWVARHCKTFTLFRTIHNRYPFDPLRPSETSAANFYFFRCGE